MSRVLVDLTKALAHVVAIPVMLCCACSSRGGGGANAAGPIAAPTASQQFSFSFSYLAEPPEGRLLRVAGLAGVAETCKVFSEDAAPDSFVAYNLTVPRGDHGTYPLSSFNDQEARLEIVSVKGGKISARRYAVAGEVEYLSGPTDEASWTKGESAKFTVSSKFDRNSVVSTECNGTQNNQTGEVQSSCTCTREDGSSSTCESSSDACCYDDPDTSLAVDFNIEATPCAKQCSFTSPDLAHYCTELRE